MPNAKDLKIDNLKLKVLPYGKSGTGKTTFACSFPKPYVFDFDNGILSQRGMDVDYDVYSGVAAYQKFEEKLRTLESECPYETIVLDSITTMQEYKMNSILQVTRKKIPTQYEWMVLITDMKDLFTRITSMDKHVVVIAHEMMVQDDMTGEIMFMPVVYGKKLPAQLPLWFDEVYRMFGGRTKEGKPEYTFSTVSDTRYVAKSRLECLEPLMTWSKEGKKMSGFEVIMEKVRGGEKK
ncbi:hypothetical protein LCGC14_0788780 [marine sediment metagenome]|uniref:AAA domain-containing protein n=1 Tax=marine sediment metagenome TaxID=412755 RepID=A0A0F9QD32_9ZZZZ